MSTFKVEVKKLSKVYPHTDPETQRLELAQVEGMTYQFVIPKGAYKEGDEVVFFPIDSLLPQEFIAQQGIGNFLSGKEKNRVRTAKLRGAISQGYVASVDSVKQYLKVDTLPDDLTEALGVTKYEPPEIKISSGNLVRLPEHVSSYDIEGCDRYPNIVEILMDLPCMISEKMEGSNAWATLDLDKKVSVGQHNYTIENIPDGPEHSFWTVARRDGILDSLYKLSEIYPGTAVTVRFEMVGPGIQGNYYQLMQLMSFVFDVEIDRRPISFVELDTILDKVGLRDRFVPVLNDNVTLRVFLGDKTVQQMSNGISMLNPGYGFREESVFDKKAKVNKLREGIVIKPMVEQNVVGFGRLFIKQRDPVYLDKTGN
jgi:RNA ligase (TIGR02306 family)